MAPRARRRSRGPDPARAPVRSRARRRPARPGRAGSPGDRRPAARFCHGPRSGPRRCPPARRRG
ncbi:hypothetical protein CK505_17515, partial [Kocuria sp. WN036]